MTGAGERRKYKNPPIEEALVEFRFVPSQEWNLTIPGKLHAHERIKQEYTGEPRTQKVVQAQLQTGGEQAPSFAVHEGLGRVQLPNLEGNRLLGIGPDTLSVNLLRPYDCWEDFRPRVEAALQAYKEIAAPRAVSRVGVRYINKIVIPASEFTLQDYFVFTPPRVQGLPERMLGFMSRVEYQYDDGIKLLLAQASIEPPKGSSAFLLDLDVVWDGGPLLLDDAMTTVDRLHELEGQAFESTITQATRDLFDAE